MFLAHFCLTVLLCCFSLSMRTKKKRERKGSTCLFVCVLLSSFFLKGCRRSSCCCSRRALGEGGEGTGDAAAAHSVDARASSPPRPGLLLLLLLPSNVLRLSLKPGHSISVPSVLLCFSLRGGGERGKERGCLFLLVAPPLAALWLLFFFNPFTHLYSFPLPLSMIINYTGNKRKTQKGEEENMK